MANSAFSKIKGWLGTLFNTTSTPSAPKTTPAKPTSTPQDKIPQEPEPRPSTKLERCIKTLSAPLLSKIDKLPACFENRAFIKKMQWLSHEDPAQAILLLRKFHEETPNDPFPLRHLALIYERRRELDVAKDLWTRLLTLAPTLRYEILERLARIAERNGDLEEAFRLFQESLGHNWGHRAAQEGCTRLANHFPQNPKPLLLITHHAPDPFELLHPLGHGAHGRVYLGRDKNLRRLVAMKYLHNHLLKNPKHVSNFIREARMIASLRHPNIGFLYDFDTDRQLIIMEYAPSGSLADRLRSGRKILPDAAFKCSQQLCSALNYAHAHGIVHRDIKPSNVLFKENGDALLSDFGVAVLNDLSKDGQVGTQRYASPEALAGKVVDARADLYGLGLLLGEMLSATPPPLEPSTHLLWLQNTLEFLPPMLTDNISAVLNLAPSSRPSNALELLHLFQLACVKR